MDGNPLRRGIDRVERVIWIILALTFFASVPLVVPLVGQAARIGGLNEIHQERTWRDVKAVLVHHAPTQVYGYNATGTVWAQGRWRAPTGALRSGLVPTVIGSAAGTVVRVWVDHNGQLTGGPPTDVGHVDAQAVGLEIVVAIGMAVVTVLLAGVLRWLTNRRRMRYWRIEWACIGPRWSTRRY